MALPGAGMVYIDQEVSMASAGRLDKDRSGKEVPWRKLRNKRKYNQEEEEQKAAMVRRVANNIRERGGLEGGEEEEDGQGSNQGFRTGDTTPWSRSAPRAGGSRQEEPAAYGPALPGGHKPPVRLEQEAGERFVLRQETSELPSGTRPDRYRGRLYKELPAGAAEMERLPPTKAVEEFKRRRAETEADRLAKKAVKSHKTNLDEFNELMDKQPAHFETRKINWYKF